MIEVFFETENGSYSDLVAVFHSEKMYIACLPTLKGKAREMGMIVTESIKDEEEK